MLKNDIGKKAGTIWRLLAENGELTLRQIGEFTGFRENVIYLALGWLAREKKIRVSNDERHIRVGLDHVA